MEESPRPRRVTLTKTQLATAAAIELVSLLQTVTADGQITEEEAAQLRDWLDDQQLTGLPAIDFLRLVVERVLVDGKVTEEECEEVHKAIERVLPLDLRSGAVSRRQEAERAKEEEARRYRELHGPIDSRDFMAAGCYYNNRSRTIHQSVYDDQIVILRREPNNPYDKNAVLLLADGKFDIGYAPRVEAVILARLLDANYRYQAWVKKILIGTRTPTPVIIVDLYRPGAIVPPRAPGNPENTPANTGALYIRQRGLSVEIGIEAGWLDKPGKSPSTNTPVGAAPAAPRSLPPAHQPSKNLAYGCLALITLILLGVILRLVIK